VGSARVASTESRTATLAIKGVEVKRRETEKKGYILTPTAN
jgi:hypothetical protein